MKNLTKLVAIGAVGLMMTACSSTYKIKSEKGKVMNTVPKWYMADYSESKACDTPWLGKDKDKMCIFGVATAVSPDLQLAIEKGKMLAKSELADIIAGEMNKESKQFITELGKTNTKTVVSEVESILVNKISNTPVRGYEIFKQDVTLTKNGYYRVWIGLRLPLGEYNKMYNFTIAEAVDAYNLKEKAQIKYKEIMSDSDENNNIQ
mgnify:FL=1